MPGAEDPRSAEPGDDEKVAIIGMAVRFPGCATLSEFWQSLMAGETLVRRFATHELEEFPELGRYGDSDFVPKGFVLEGPDLFDSGFFGYSPAEAERLDPQQRLFLEVCWHALEDAGVSPEKTRATIGVYGAANPSYYCTERMPSVPISAFEAYVESTYASDRDYMTSRAAYKLNLTGPAITIQTGCSSSLAAAAVAVTDLLTHGCDVGIVGAAAIRSREKVGYLRRPSGWLSHDGIPRPFDAESSGMVPGTGVGAVALKRLADARRDRDRIYAVIAGSGVANDGSDKVHFGAPSMKGQVRAIRSAMAMAGVRGDDIGMVEAHAPGTPIGDAIEIASLRAAYGAGAQRRRYLGALKANIGQTAAAAGVAGLVKAALCLHRGEIPPHPTFRTPHPENRFELGDFEINTSPVSWPRGEKRRCLGVSAFAAGGTNVHMVLEEAPEPEENASGETAGIPILFPASAKRRGALDRFKAALGERLEIGNVACIDAAYTLIDGRTDFAARSAVSARDVTEAAQRLTSAPTVAVPPNPRLVLALSGSGEGDNRNAALLYEEIATFRESADRVGAAVAGQVDVDPLALFTGGSHASSGDESRTLADLAFGYAMAKLLESLGVRPQAVVGQGALAPLAGHLAGIFPLETAVALAVERIGASGEPPSELPGAFQGIQLQRPGIRYLRYGSSDFADPANAATPEFWHGGGEGSGGWRENVRALANWGATATIDAGAGGELIPHAEGSDGPGWTLFPVSPHGGTFGEREFFDLLAALWSNGVADDTPRIVLDRADPRRRARKVSLPGYHFARERHWIDVEPRSADTGAAAVQIAAAAPESEWLLSPAWTETVAAATTGAGSALVVGGDADGLGGALAAALNVPHLAGAPGEASVPEAALARTPPDAVIWCLWPAQVANPDDAPRAALAKALACRDAVADLARTIASTGRPHRLIVVTRGLASVRGDEWLAPEFALMLGPLRCQPHETPLLACQVADIEDSPDHDATAAHLAKTVAAFRPDSTLQCLTALRGGRLWLRELRNAGHVPEAAKLPDRGRYVILGGDSQMARAIASGLAEGTAQAKIGLIVRPRPDRAADRAAFVDELTSRHGARAVFAEADIAAPGAAVAMRNLAARLGGVDGVIHAAGTSCWANDEGSPRRDVDPRVRGALAVEEAFGDSPLEFLVLCSAAQAQWGGAGRAEATGADAFLDHFALSERLPLCRRTLSIGWDHWREPDLIKETSVFRGEPRPEPLNRGLTERQGRQWFMRCLAAPLRTPVISMLVPQYYAEVLRQQADKAIKRFAAESGTQVVVDDVPAGKPRPDLDTPYKAPERPMERLLAMLWSENLGYANLGIHDRYADLGGDETSALDLLWQIHLSTGFDMPMALFCELQTIEKCGEHLWRKELKELRKLQIEADNLG